jgi:HD-like signal output (HDOD) protein
VKGGLYHNAIGTALIAKELADYRAVCPGRSYTVGLLHDIGKVVLDPFIAPNLPFFYHKTQNDLINLEEMELEIIGIGHSEAGGKLASLWSIPRNLGDAIQYHHQPEKCLA